MQSSRHSFKSLANIEESTLARSTSTSSDTNLHTFVETTYYHPTFCNLCGGLLVGLFKQGLKCKSCRFNVHKGCMKKVANNCGVGDEENKLDVLKMHSFVDKTYFNPTYCNFCGGLLVGLVLFKQGLQCKYCKYDCHKNCLRFVPRHCEANNCSNYDELTRSSRTNTNTNSSNNTAKHDKKKKIGRRISLTDLIFDKKSSRFENFSSKLRSSSVVNEKIPENKTENSQTYEPTSYHPTAARNTSLISERILANCDFKINEECDSIDSYKSSSSQEKITVNDFHLLKLIGKGSFGKVFLVSTKSQRCEYYALKALKKSKIIQQNDVQSTKLERDIANLGYVNRFITKLFCAFQDNEFIYFVMEFLNGGDLMFHIENSGKFTEPRAKFYAAEILCGLEFLHSEGIVYRDLKLDNILLDSYGHCKMSDFGMCRLLRPGELAETFCGTPDYIAPEILQGDMYDFAVDYWSYGIIIYEMLLGKTPFIGQDEEELFQAIKDKEIIYPNNELSPYSIRLLKSLLERDPKKRIGSKTSQYGNIRDHPFFFTIDWLKLEMGAIESPFRPNVITVIDVANFDTNLTKEIPSLSDSKDKLDFSNDQDIFKGFSFKNKNFNI